MKLNKPRVHPQTTTVAKHINKKETSLSTFPPELLLLIFKYLDLCSLLSVYNVSKRFNSLANCVLSSVIDSSPQLSLKLTFEQEHKWRSTITFKFSHIDSTNNIIFKPKRPMSMTFYQSTLLQNPALSRVSLTGAEDSPKEEFPQKSNTNLLQGSCPLPIKDLVDHSTGKTTYKIGEGSRNLAASYKFSYSVKELPVQQRINTRSGGRKIVPQSFACPIQMFYPHEPTTHKLFRGLVAGFWGWGSRKKIVRRRKVDQNPLRT